MTDTRKREKMVIMAREVATRYVSGLSKPMYRMDIYSDGVRTVKLVRLLKSFRNGKVAISGVLKASDLGVEERSDIVSIWTSDRNNLINLNKWLEKLGIETSGVW